jgi:hypothetical protein
MVPACTNGGVSGMLRTLSLVLMSATTMLPQIVWAQATPVALTPTTHTIGSQEAMVTWVHGSVEISSPAPTPAEHSAATGELLTRGMRIHVGEGASAEVTLSNGSVIELGERAQLLMFASPTPPPAGQPPSVTTTLQRGTLRVRMSPTPNAVLVPLATGSVTAFVGRSDGMISADLGGHITRVAVHRGRMRVRAMTREYILRAGTGSFEEFGRPPMPYRQLPAQPVWTTPLPERVISGGEPVEVSATYGVRGPGAITNWRIEFSNEPNFREPISVTRVAGTITRWHNPRLEPGTYYLRVTALDTDRFESVPSAVGRVIVAAPRIETGRVASENQPARVAHVNVPEGFLCGLDGAAPVATSDPLRLAPGRHHTLRCTTNTNPSDVREITVPATQSGPLVREVSHRSIAYNEGVLAVRLFDAEGRAVPYADVQVRNDQNVVVERVREAPERGVYNASIHWPRGVTRARFTFVINDDETFEQDLTQSQ